MADILFVNAMKEQTLNQEVNGTLLLGTKLLQAGFDTKVLRFCQIESYHVDYEKFIEDITGEILRVAPKCVSFYTLWPYYHILLRVAKEVKSRAPQIHTVLGGPQSSATAMATMKAMDYIDFICTGEGENTTVPFFRALLTDGEGLDAVPGLFYRKGGQILSNSTLPPLCDLNTLPHWDSRLYTVTETPEQLAAGNYYMPIDAGRGCPYNCSFCCTSYFWRRTYRLKSPERILEDIRYYYDAFGIRSFWFSHDAFTTDRDLVGKVCDRIIDSGMNIRWKCSSRVDCLTEELVEKMIRSGLTEIELGIETGSERMQKKIHKNLNLQRAKRMISFLVSKGLFVSLYFMFGFPEETEEELNETLEFMFSLLDSGVQKAGMFLCRFNPATEITQQYMDRLVLDPRIKILSRGVFGYEQELEVIGKNKELFPYFYHLNTPVRDNYQYLLYLVHLYQRFPNSAKYIRRLYGGDNLRFYRDFAQSNRHIFQKGSQYTMDCLNHRPVEMMGSMLDVHELNYAPQLKELLRFVNDVQRIQHSREDLVIEETYGFSFLDFKLRRPIEEYTSARSVVRMQKIGGVTDMRVLKLI